jgi:hypothetical protein
MMTTVSKNDFDRRIRDSPEIGAGSFCVYCAGGAVNASGDGYSKLGATGVRPGVGGFIPGASRRRHDRLLGRRSRPGDTAGYVVAVAGSGGSLCAVATDSTINAGGTMLRTVASHGTFASATGGAHSRPRG